MRQREIALLEPLLDYLGSLNSIRLLGPRDAARRAPTVAMVTDRPGEDVAAELASHGINVGGGGFYSVRPLEAMGIDLAHGVLRVSFTHYTSEAEVERLIGALHHVL
jgi:selenocysteine lyase/cysteine desulfurase